MDPLKTEQAPEQERVESANLEDSIADTFDELEAETEVEAEPEEKPTTEEVVEETYEELEEEVAVEAAEETTLEEAIEDYAEVPPERWPDEMKEVYNNLPPAAKEAMLEGIYKPMQRQYGQTTQELSEMRKGLEPMLESMNQYRGDFERMGVNPAEAFRRQMAWASHLARVGPEQGLKDMSASYGLNQVPQGQSEEQYLTPVEREMQTKLDTLSQQVSGQQNFQQEQSAAQQQYAQQSRFNEVQSGLNEFTNEQRDGKPAHPHIEKVAPAVAGLIRGGLVTQSDDYGRPVPVRDQLAQAYQMACDLDPSIRSAAPRNVRQVARAKAAQNVGVVTNTPVTTESGELNTLGESIESLYDRLAGSG
jgi:hypothetical protein